MRATLQGSYGADQDPYRRPAFDRITANPDNLLVKNAIAGVQGLYQNTIGRGRAGRASIAV